MCSLVAARWTRFLLFLIRARALIVYSELLDL